MNEKRVNRLHELAKIIAAGPSEAILRETTMRGPAEPDRDADLVLSWAHDELRRLYAENRIMRTALQEIEVAAAEDADAPGAEHYDWIRERAQKALASSRESPNG